MGRRADQRSGLGGGLGLGLGSNISFLAAFDTSQLFLVTNDGDGRSGGRPSLWPAVPCPPSGGRCVSQAAAGISP